MQISRHSLLAKIDPNFTLLLLMSKTSKSDTSLMDVLSGNDLKSAMRGMYTRAKGNQAYRVHLNRSNTQQGGAASYVRHPDQVHSRTEWLYMHKKNDNNCIELRKPLSTSRFHGKKYMTCQQIKRQLVCQGKKSRIEHQRCVYKSKGKSRHPECI